MRLLTPLATLLGFQLMHTTVLAGGAYHKFCFCRIAYTAVEGVADKVDREATRAACDAINHSDYLEYPDAHFCQSTEEWGINGNCWDCLCKRTRGLYGDCGGDDQAGWFDIKCGGGC